MGFFSVNCLGCGHSLRSPHTHGAGNWMSFAVVFPETGGKVLGEYDGYGRFMGRQGSEGDEPTIGFDNVSAYHRACWMILGQPDHFTVASDDAHDQGYFCGSAPAKPTTMDDLAALRASAEYERNEARKSLHEAAASLDAAVDDIKF